MLYQGMSEKSSEYVQLRSFVVRGYASVPSCLLWQCPSRALLARQARRSNSSLSPPAVACADTGSQTAQTTHRLTEGTSEDRTIRHRLTVEVPVLFATQ